MTPFMFAAAGEKDAKNMGVPGCGGCHPGGGGLEFDRDGKRYDARLKEDPKLASSLDGDYFKSQWDKTGVVEADCFICHLPNYNSKERNKQLKKLNFRWAATAASGIGQVEGFVDEGKQPTVSYNLRFFNQDGKIALDFPAEPPSENCVFCHGMSDMKKRGFSWNDRVNHDVHNMRGMSCVSCHPSDKNHNFAKGQENVSTVRDDLDNTIKKCADCHTTGYMGAPRPEHAFIRPSHLEMLACETCHIPAINRAGGEGFDVTSGGMVNYPKIGAKGMGAEFKWEPRYQLLKRGQISPVNPLLVVTWTNRDADGTYTPLFMREIKKAYDLVAPKLQAKNPAKPELHTPEQIGMMLTALNEALKGNKRFKAVAPAYHKGGEIHELGPDGKVVTRKDETWVAHMEGFNINHNVAPAKLALGANGCADCHSEKANMFLGRQVADMFGPDGKPVYTDNARILGVSHAAFRLNAFYQAAVVPYGSWIILLVGFLLTLHYTGQGPKGLDARCEPGEIERFGLAERWTHLLRMLAFMALAATGYVFFTSNATLAKALFGSYKAAIVWHWAAGLVFTGAGLYAAALWARDAVFTSYDRTWFALRGGYLGRKGDDGHAPAGRLNAGQKVFFWLSLALTLVMAATGVPLIWKQSLSASTALVLATIHGVGGVLFVAVALAHAYLGTVANPGTWRALVDGKVSRAWAAEHHSEWFKKHFKK
ncbi:cytochrome b/b6 domain-containing protein [Fundidesulfovibrio soli]|uniref:cytochrome b/b6 domain-containing protein n=1 Tax=Fundidesulfovibrio soli TaxID=2922716 RepID=UPI001FAFDA2F|nr:cytochrome b/b6 domain-containing protein [Fundidesulfovibrio soli]